MFRICDGFGGIGFTWSISRRPSEPQETGKLFGLRRGLPICVGSEPARFRTGGDDGIGVF